MFTMNQGPQLQLPPTPVVWLDGSSQLAYHVEISAEIPQSTLDELGQDGWQLCGILPRKTDAIYYFARLI